MKKKKPEKPWKKVLRARQVKKKKKKKKKPVALTPLKVTRLEVETLAKLLTEATDDLLKLRAKLINLTCIWEAKLRSEEEDDLPF